MLAERQSAFCLADEARRQWPLRRCRPAFGRKTIPLN